MRNDYFSLTCIIISIYLFPLDGPLKNRLFTLNKKKMLRIHDADSAPCTFILFLNLLTFYSSEKYYDVKTMHTIVVLSGPALFVAGIDFNLTLPATIIFPP